MFCHLFLAASKLKGYFSIYLDPFKDHKTETKLRGKLMSLLNYLLYLSVCHVNMYSAIPQCVTFNSTIIHPSSFCIQCRSTLLIFNSKDWF